MKRKELVTEMLNNFIQGPKEVEEDFSIFDKLYSLNLSK